MAVRELIAQLEQICDAPLYDNHNPVILQCGRRNYRLYAVNKGSDGKPVLVGRRSGREQ